MPTRRLFVYTENYVYGGVERFIFDLLAGLGSGVEAVVLFNENPDFRARLTSRVARRVEPRELAIRSRPLLTGRLKRALGDFGGRAAGRLLAPLVGPRHDAFNEELIHDALRAFGAGAGDVLHIVNGGYPGAASCGAAARAAKRAGVGRVLYSVLSVHEPSRSPAIPAAAEQRLLAAADLVVTNSKAGARSLIEHRGFPAGKVTTVWTAVGDPGVSPDAAARARARWAAPDELLIGCVGAVYPLKGHRHALEAMPRILKEEPCAKLVVIGDGESRASLIARAEALGLSSKVAFPGYFDGNVLETVAGFDLLLHPSCETEGLPYAVLEAMSLGKAAVVADVGGAAETVENGVTGIVVPPSDPGAIASACLALLGDEKKRLKMGEAALARQKSLFALDAMNRRLAELYAR